MSLFDKLAQKLALRWLKSKADKARKEGSKVLKLADGWKCLVIVVGFIGATLVALTTGNDVSVLFASALLAMGWNDASYIHRVQVLATEVGPLLLALWAAAARLWTAWKQFRAGAKPKELLSIEGCVKLAQAESGVRPTGDVTIPPQEERRKEPR